MEEGGRGQDNEGDATQLVLLEERAFPGHLQDPLLVVAVLGGLNHVDVCVRGQGDQKQVREAVKIRVRLQHLNRDMFTVTNLLTISVFSQYVIKDSLKKKINLVCSSGTL